MKAKKKPTPKPTVSRLKKLTLNDVRVIVVADQRWAKGETLEWAMKQWQSYTNSKKPPKNYLIYLVHPDTIVDDYGMFRFKPGYNPVLLGEVGKDG